MESSERSIQDREHSLLESKDAGKTWQRRVLPPSGFILMALAAHLPSDSLWVAGQIESQDSRALTDAECPQRGIDWQPAIFYKNQSNPKWTEQRLPIQNGCPVTEIHFVDARRGVAVAQGAVFYTLDAGEHWNKSRVSPPVARSANSPSSLVFLTGSDRIAGLSYEAGDIFKTEDGGATWRQIVKRGEVWAPGSGMIAWGAICFSAELTGWTLGGNGEVFETVDGAVTWTRVPAPERLIYLSGTGGKCWAGGISHLYRLELAL